MRMCIGIYIIYIFAYTMKEVYTNRIYIFHIS